MYQGKHIAVLGLGVAGIHSTRILVELGAIVYAWDDTESACYQVRNMPCVQLCNMQHMDMQNLDFVVASPGIPDTHPICKKALACGIPLVGEVKLRYDLSPQATYVGITGTNGKSTTTALVAHILNSVCIPHAVGGNFTTPAVALPNLGMGGVYVMEMSSYMLTRINGMRFDVAGLLNISPDHLTWHGNMENYVTAKMRIFDNMNDGAVICTDDDMGNYVTEILQNRGCDVHTVSYKNAEETIYLKGNHNRQNISVAVAICEKLGIDKTDILNACTTFQGLKHRQQVVYQDENMIFINDSKATNVQSTIMALGCYENIHWIAGGQEKGDGYVDIIPYLHRISYAYLIGEGAQNIANFLDTHHVPYIISGHMQQAVSDVYACIQQTAGQMAHVVLLSPACASWDQFNNFAHRGDVFIECVQLYTQGGRT